MMSKKLIIAIIAVIVLVVIFVLMLILGGSRKNNSSATLPPEDKKVVNIVDIIGDPVTFEGLTVEVESQITDWVTKRAFTLEVPGEGGFGGGGDDQLLAIRKTPFPLPENVTGKGVGLGEKVNARVKGEIRILDRDQLIEELGVDIDSKSVYAKKELESLDIFDMGDGTSLDLDYKDEEIKINIEHMESRSKIAHGLLSKSYVPTPEYEASYWKILANDIGETVDEEELGDPNEAVDEIYRVLNTILPPTPLNYRYPQE